MNDNSWNLNLAKTDKIILSLIFGLPVLGFVVIPIVLSFFDNTPKQEIFLRSESILFFKGKVISEYRDNRNHNVKVAVLNNDYKYQIMPEWEDSIKTGDSLIKEKDSLYVMLIKSKTRDKIKLDYKEATKNWR